MGGGPPPDSRPRPACTFLRTGRSFLGPQAARIFDFFIFFRDFFGTGARLGPDFAPLSLQTLILIASGLVLEGVQTPRILKKPWFSLGFSRFFVFPLCSLMLALGLHFWSLWAPFGTPFRAMFAPSSHPGPPFAFKVGLLGGLSASKLGSWEVFGRLGLQVGVLSQLWASNLAS